jgi:DNA-binding NarL/FixJ family response regulator
MICKPSIAILSSDPAIAETAQHVAAPGWRIELAAWEPSNRFPSSPGLRIVIFDDETVPHADRAFALSRIRKRAPNASMLYVAASHDTCTERQARVSGAQYYCSKPIDRSEFEAVLDSFLRAAK